MSVLRYPGGKTRAVKHILPLIPDDISTLYSPFFGGGSIEISASSTKSNLVSIHANDKFEPLITFWETCKTHDDSLTSKLRQKKTCIDKDYFTVMRKSMREMGTTIDKVERASMYFCINRCSFSGATFSGGFSKESSESRFTTSSIDRIAKLDLSKFNFHNLDYSNFFANVVDKHDNDIGGTKPFLYADPPYALLKGNSLYGNDGDLHESFDHTMFRDVIVACKIPWLLSYNDCPSIRELYAGYEILETQWSYSMNASKKSSEILVKSNAL